MNLITILSNDVHPDRTWCGNDEKGRLTWHASLPLAHDPVSIRLSWTAKHEAPEQYIGTFLLHLASLLTAGFIRADTPGQVRVKFVNDHGVIKLAQGLKSSGIVLGVRQEQ
jgi:hypothetical protein